MAVHCWCTRCNKKFEGEYGLCQDCKKIDEEEWQQRKASLMEGVQQPAPSTEKKPSAGDTTQFGLLRNPDLKLPDWMWKDNADGRGIAQYWALPSVRFDVRFLGEVLAPWFHYVVNMPNQQGGYQPCFQPCPYCTKGMRRTLCGRADVLLEHKDPGLCRIVIDRRILRLTHATIELLYEQVMRDGIDNKSEEVSFDARGVLASLCHYANMKYAKPSVVENSCEYALPESCDLYSVFERTCYVTNWPLRPKASDSENHILKFKVG